IPAEHTLLAGNLTIPQNSEALVLFAHGSGSSRHSPRNQFVARTLNRAGLGTLLFDLLTPEEEALDIYTREHRFNIYLLVERLLYPATRGRARLAHRICRLEHRRRGGAGRSSGTSTGRRCRRFPWWTTRPSW